jgi:hypothetical protein
LGILNWPLLNTRHSTVRPSANRDNNRLACMPQGHRVPFGARQDCSSSGASMPHNAMVSPSISSVSPSMTVARPIGSARPGAAISAAVKTIRASRLSAYIA